MHPAALRAVENAAGLGCKTVGDIPEKYDRVYKATDRETDTTYEVSVARLECTCPEFTSRRAHYPRDDARRVCAIGAVNGRPVLATYNVRTRD